MTGLPYLFEHNALNSILIFNQKLRVRVMAYMNKNMKDDLLWDLESAQKKEKKLVLLPTETLI